MSELKFEPANTYGIKFHFLFDENRKTKFSVIEAEDNRFYLRVKGKDGWWRYPVWGPETGYDSLQGIKDLLEDTDLVNTTLEEYVGLDQSVSEDVQDALNLFGMKATNSREYTCCMTTPKGQTLSVSVKLSGDTISTSATIEGRPVPSYHLPVTTCDCSRFVRGMDRLLQKYSCEVFAEMSICDGEDAITAAINTRNLAKDIVRVKSSNIWGYNIRIKDKKSKNGDVIVQFKGDQGGPGDVYIYYDVPVIVYRRWHTAPSKGHYFWQYIRHNFKYSKLTGDKRGKLPNAIN